jgi:predicted small integral membrane protein
MLNWMAWTQPTAIFFAVIAGILVVMTIWEIKRPCVERKGWLPIATTRGDRLFIGLLSSAFMHLIALGALDEVNLYWVLVACITWVIALIRFG